MPSLAFLLPLSLTLAARAAGPIDDPLAGRIEKTMRGRTVFQSVGPIETPLPQDLANFLLDHPDFAAAIVRARGIAPYRVTMRGPRQSWVDDGDGTVGLITEAWRGEERRVYYGDGTHKSRLLPDIHADAVIIMEIRPVPRPGCEPRIRSTFDVYVKLRNPLLSGMVSVLPFVKSTIIRKFSKAFLVADRVGRLLEKAPQALAETAASFPLEAPDRAEVLRLIARQSAQPASCR